MKFIILNKYDNNNDESILIHVVCSMLYTYDNDWIDATKRWNQAINQ